MRALALALLIAALAPAAAAALPATCSYQGKLEVDGQPFEGSADFKFAILCDGTETLWSNDGTSVNGSEPGSAVALGVSDGIFSVLLGDPTLAMLPLGAELLDGCAAPTLRVWVDAGGGVEQLADQGLASTPLALVSEVALRATSGFSVDGGGLVLRGGNKLRALDAGNATTAYIDASDGTVGCEILRFDDGTTMTTALPASDADWIVDGDDMYAGVPGNVGIGTSTPSARLEVAGDARVAGDLTVEGTLTSGLRTRYYSPSLSAFMPVSSTMDYEASYRRLQGATINQSLVFAAPLDLPDGALITEFRVYLRDLAGSADLQLGIGRVLLGAPTVDASDVASTETSGAPDYAVLSVTVPNHPVDNATYSYHIKASWITPSPTNAIYLYGVRVTYLAP